MKTSYLFALILEHLKIQKKERKKTAKISNFHSTDTIYCFTFYIFIYSLFLLIYYKFYVASKKKKKSNDIFLEYPRTNFSSFDQIMQ